MVSMVDTAAFCKTHSLSGARACASRSGSGIADGEALYSECSPADYAASVVSSADRHVLIDVRPPVQYNLCRIKNAINVPLKVLKRGIPDFLISTDVDVYVICRRGIASKAACRLLASSGNLEPGRVHNISGGMVAWSAQVDCDGVGDETLPIY